MTVTNTDAPAADDSKEVTEDDLRSLKYGSDGVENSQEEDEPNDDATDDNEDSKDTGDDDAKSDDDSEEEGEQSDSSEDTSYVKEFPNIKGGTPEEYAKNLEEAYKNSTAEALRLKGIADAPKTDPIDIAKDDEDDKPPASTLELYAQQQLDRDITAAYNKFSNDYPQVTDPVEYNKFTTEVSVLSTTIYQSQKRLASPDELYSKAAVILGWEKESTPSGKDKLDMAVKDNAASSKTTSASPKGTTKSKVTDEMIKVNRAMYPNKSDADIRKELEPYV